MLKVLARYLMQIKLLNGHVAPFCFVEKCHDNKNDYPPSHFYKEYHERKMKNIHATSYC